jgi:hypothetical protein
MVELFNSVVGALGAWVHLKRSPPRWIHSVSLAFALEPGDGREDASNNSSYCSANNPADCSAPQT